MTDNARIGSALEFAIHALRANGGAPCDLSAASGAEAELQVLLDDRASLDAMTTLLARARNERDAIKAELATAQADLERAREEAKGRTLPHTFTGFAGITDPVPSGCQCSYCAEERGGWLLARSMMRVCPECGDKRCPKAEHHANPCRAAMAPEEKGE